MDCREVRLRREGGRFNAHFLCTPFEDIPKNGLQSSTKSEPLNCRHLQALDKTASTQVGRSSTGGKCKRASSSSPTLLEQQGPPELRCVPVFMVIFLVLTSGSPIDP